MDKYCPKCAFKYVAGALSCPRCGIYFEKYLKHHAPKTEINQSVSVTYKQTLREKLRAYDWHYLLFYVEEQTNELFLLGRLITYVIALVWGLVFIFSSIDSNYVGESFMHLINLPFHEAGHVIFRPFGSFITSLGGTLGQLLIPLICLWTFLFKYRNTFGASIALWWLGQNFLDIAPYISDARAGILPLVGGNTGHTSPYGFHDWEYLLTETGLLQYDKVIAKLSFLAGSIIILVALVWGAYLLSLQVKKIKKN